MMYARKITRGTMVMALLLLPALALSSAPEMVPFQGFVRDADDTPLTGTADVTIRLFTLAAGGDLLFTESFAGTPVNDGVFHVMLGTGGGLPAAIWNSAEIYVETEVNGETLSPRRRIGSAPFALRAAVADVALNAGTADDDWVIENGNVYRSGGNVGVGNSAPLRRLHLGSGLGIVEGNLSQDDIVVEEADAYLGLYSNDNGSDGSGIVMGEVESGVLQDKWTIKRRTTGIGSHLDFIHTPSGDPSTQVLRLSPTGRVGVNTTAPQTELHVVGDAMAYSFNATSTLGESGTPATGSVHADNVVYAWARINGNGSTEFGYGIQSVTRLGAGHYRIIFKRSLPGAVIPVVTAYSANDIVNARIASVGVDRCEVKTALWIPGNGDFTASDYRFLIQVVGRP